MCLFGCSSGCFGVVCVFDKGFVLFLYMLVCLMCFDCVFVCLADVFAV